MVSFKHAYMCTHVDSIARAALVSSKNQEMKQLREQQVRSGIISAVLLNHTHVHAHKHADSTARAALVS